MRSEIVLVTGGAGYIGAHVCLVLAEHGYQPIVVDDLSQGHRHAVRFGPIEQIDIRSPDLVDVVARHQPIAVVHAAAKSEVAASFANPSLYHQVNVFGTRNVVRACRAAAVPHLVMFSSAAIYGACDGGRPMEDAPLQPVSPYGMTKLAGEAMLRDAAGSWAILRLFNVAGAAPTAGLGEEHRVETHLVPLAIRAALGMTQSLDVFGIAYRTPDGSAIRDYVHVMDVAEAVALTLEHLRMGGTSGTFNIGSGVGTSVLEIARVVARAAGSDIPLRIHGPRDGDPAMLVADVSRAASVLGFRAMMSVDQIVGDALLWERSRSSRSRFA
jgi:UDP-arabinose 4-epimerase